MKSLFILSFLFCLFKANTQSLTFKAGGHFNRTIQKSTPEIGSFTFDDFSPKNGYQLGLIYKQPLIKSFFLDAEIGYLNKGHVRVVPQQAGGTRTYNYNYVTLTPAIGYDLPFGFSLKGGIGINRLLTTSSVFPLGVVEKTEYALSTVLSYNYKRMGLELSHSNSIKPIQEIMHRGVVIEHYHEWYAASLSYTFFKKRNKTL
jgi:hypothetical protein